MRSCAAIAWRCASIQPNLTGGQLMRRKGQSLEFREHMPYMPGDDVRFVDWRASARHGGRDDLVVRSFVAEEQLRLLISVDPRATMHLPGALPKLQIAQWLVEALVRVAEQSGDQIYLHWLFDQRASAPALVGTAAQLWRVLEKRSPASEEAPANLRHLQSFLPPTAIWLIITDSYFQMNDDARALATTIVAAQRNMCWVLLLELDSWPHERAVMGQDVWQISQLGAQEPGDLVELSAANLEAVEQRIEEHRAQFLNLTRLPPDDLLRWQWPAEVLPDREQFFNKAFFVHDRRIHDIFVKQSL